MFRSNRLIALSVLTMGSLSFLGLASSNADPAPLNPMDAGAKPAAMAADMAAPKDIVDTAVAAGQFNTLAAALKAAGLVDTLKSAGPFTVFAPTDEAFAKLPAGTVESLLKPENKDKLVAILTYHVAAGKVMSSDLKDGQMVKTVNGKEVAIKLADGKAMVGSATVTKADIVASNGVIHVIDTVLIP